MQALFGTGWRHCRLDGRSRGPSCMFPSSTPTYLHNGGKNIPRRRATAAAGTQPTATTTQTPSPAQPQTLSTTTRAPALPLIDLLLADVRVILVAPKHEANIGAAARACANFECLSLFIVAPRCDADSGEARKVACGDAVLDRLIVTSTLAEALADTTGSIGFTRRAGATRVTHASLGHLLAEFPWAVPLQPPPAAAAGTATSTSLPDSGEPCGSAQTKGLVDGAEEAVAGLTPEGPAGSSSSSSSNRPPYATALVFGREESGLTEAELRLCSYACAIPTGRVQPSMNLSHAVSVALAELFSRRCGLLDVASLADVDHATAAMAGDDGLQLLQLPTARSGTGAVQGTRGSSASNQAGEELSGSARAAAAYNTTAMAVAGPSGREGAVAPGGSMDAGLLPASTQEVDLLVRKVAAVAEAVGLSGEEGTGGGGNHGRRRLPVGYLRSVVSRARLNAAESRSLHGLASAVLQRVAPDHPLEARKLHQKRKQRKQVDEGNELSS